MTRHCEHVKANGHFCGSPAMRDRNYCFFHLNHIGQRLRLERYAAHGLQCPPLELPLLEDAASIQLALMQVTEALLNGRLDPKRGGLVLYALQTASSNLRNMAKDAKEEDTVAVCNRYDSFEQDYELDEKSTAGLRVEEPADGENLDAKAAEIMEGARYAGLIPDEANARRTEEADASDSSGDDAGEAEPTVGPINVFDREPFDRTVRIPSFLSPVQYEQAKVSIFGYEMDHNISRENPHGRKPTPQRAAISQKLFVGARKPVASVRVEEEEWASVAKGNA